jgi:hypothetical protein
VKLDAAKFSRMKRDLAKAVKTALPFAIAKANGEKIAAICLVMDPMNGSCTFGVLTETAAKELKGLDRYLPGEWPILSDNDDDELNQAIESNWERWESWICDQMADWTEEKSLLVENTVLPAACECLKQLEMDGTFNAIPKAEHFEIIVADDDEPLRNTRSRYKNYKSL